MLGQILFSHTVTVQGMFNRLPSTAQTARKLVWIREYTSLINRLNKLWQLLCCYYMGVLSCEVSNLNIIVFHRISCSYRMKN